MKKNWYSPSLIAFSIIVFGLLNTIAGCSSNEPYVYLCKDGIIDSQKAINLKHFQSTINPADSLAILVIRTEEEYRNYIVDRLVNIDFSRETLLAGRVRTAMPGRVITQSVTSSCASNNLVYDVKIKVNTGGITAYAETPFFITIPKIPESTKVTFNVHF